MTTLYITGDKIGTFERAVFSGNNENAALAFPGSKQPAALGSASDNFRIEVRQTNEAEEAQNGQFWDVYDADGKLLFANMNPKIDEFQGRAGSSHHVIFSDQKVVIDIHGLTNVYNNRNDDKGRLQFKCLQQAPCFLAGTDIGVEEGVIFVQDLVKGDMVVTDGKHAARVVHITSHLVSEPLYEIDGLIVTGQHRILYTKNGVTGLIRAKHHPDAVERVYAKPQRVYSVFTDRQCVLMANGVWAASSKPGPELLKLVGPAEEAKLTEVLSDLAAYCADAPYPDMNKRGEIKQ